jgi:transcription factor SPT20
VCCLHHNAALFLTCIGCLIVQIQNFRDSTGSTVNSTTNQVGGASVVPFSIHNHHEHIIPSPFVDIRKRIENLEKSAEKRAAGKKSASRSGDNAVSKENVPAAASHKNAFKGPKTFTTVLFPTLASVHAEINILGRTEYKDQSRRQNSIYSRDGLPPPTPLASVPSTPITAKATPAQKPRMMLDGTNVKEFEAALAMVTNPVLYLEPAKSFEDQAAIMGKLRDSLHDGPAPKPKTRKRTVAEVAADEAQAAKEERFLLNYDESYTAATIAAATSGRAAGVSSEAQVGVSYDRSFKRLKTLETIKLQHAKIEQERRDQEARLQQAKNQQAKNQQAAAEEAKRREMREMQQKKLQQQAQLEQYKRQREKDMAQLQNNIAASNAQKLARSAAALSPRTAQGGAAPMSPDVRQSSPGSPPTPDNNAALAGVPMARDPSSQGISSPARPPSAAQRPNGVAMQRQISQVTHSNTGTPQALSTPNMANVGPVRNMTPQPMHGSPAPNHQSTPIMMPPTNGQLTPEQQQQLTNMNMYRNRMMHQQQLAAQQGLGMPGTQLSPQQMQMMQMQRQLSQQGGAVQNPVANGMPGNPSMQMAPGANGQPANPLVALANQVNTFLQNMMRAAQNTSPILVQLVQTFIEKKKEWEGRWQLSTNARKMNFLNTHGGAPNPQQIEMFRNNELIAFQTHWRQFTTQAQVAYQRQRTLIMQQQHQHQMLQQQQQQQQQQGPQQQQPQSQQQQQQQQAQQQAAQQQAAQQQAAQQQAAQQQAAQQQALQQQAAQQQAAQQQAAQQQQPQMMMNQGRQMMQAGGHQMSVQPSTQQYAQALQQHKMNILSQNPHLQAQHAQQIHANAQAQQAHAQQAHRNFMFQNMQMQGLTPAQMQQMGMGMAAQGQMQPGQGMPGGQGM